MLGLGVGVGVKVRVGFRVKVMVRVRVGFRGSGGAPSGTTAPVSMTTGRCAQWASAG